MPKITKRLFHILSDDELQRVRQIQYVTGNGDLSIRYRALIALMLDTGPRREDVVSLTLDSINLSTRRLTVIGKGNKEWQMVFSPAVRDCLKAFLSIREVDQPLFHLTSAGIRAMFRRIQLDCGLERFHPHQLRRQFATALLRQGINLEVIGMMLGQEDYNTTRRYIPLDDSDIEAVHEAASPFEALMGKPAPVELSRRRRRYANQRTA
jgi:site-specific recombinase XerD